MSKKTKGKLFIDEKKNIKIEEYDYNNIDYFEVIKREKIKGFKQVILTSEIMINLISNYFYLRRFRIIKISFIEEDETLLEDANYYIDNLKRNRNSFKDLEDWLEVLNSDDSIDIKQVIIQGKSTESENEITIILNVNGTFITEDAYFKKESEYLKNNLMTLL